MAEIQTDLIGRWVRKASDYTRGVVRGVWVEGGRVHVLVQIRHNRYDYDNGELVTWDDFELSEEFR